jgi:putative oxidoreductase
VGVLQISYERATERRLGTCPNKRTHETAALGRCIRRPDLRRNGVRAGEAGVEKSLLLPAEYLRLPLAALKRAIEARQPSSGLVHHSDQGIQYVSSGYRNLLQKHGMSEIAGSLGIVLPMPTNIAPWMSPWAAIGLAIIMLLAIGFHVRRHESVAVPVILFLLARFVVFGRFSQWTLTRDQTLPSPVLPGSLATRKLFRTDSSRLPRI